MVESWLGPARRCCRPLHCVKEKDIWSSSGSRSATQECGGYLKKGRILSFFLQGSSTSWCINAFYLVKWPEWWTRGDLFIIGRLVGVGQPRSLVALAAAATYYYQRYQKTDQGSSISPLNITYRYNEDSTSISQWGSHSKVAVSFEAVHALTTTVYSLRL
jgi:hypothetical protein